MLLDRTRDFVSRPLGNSSLCTATRSHFLGGERAVVRRLQNSRMISFNDCKYT